MRANLRGLFPAPQAVPLPPLPFIKSQRGRQERAILQNTDRQTADNSAVLFFALIFSKFSLNFLNIVVH
jgi:hypothetical protein